MKATLSLLFLSIVMTACVYNEELTDVTDLYTAKQETSLQYSIPANIKGTETFDRQSIPSDAFAQVKIWIRNKMPDLHLIVEGIKLCNIHLSGTYHFATKERVSYWESDTTKTTLAIETGHLELSPNDETRFPEEGNILFIPQTTKAWNPTYLPQNSSSCYLLVNCKIYNIHDTTQGYQEGKEVMIWGNEKGNSAEVAIPLSIQFLSNQENYINIELSSDCPWYNINDSQPTPILVPITFDGSVEDWQNV